MKGILRIGTSGIVLPGPKKTFPQEFQSCTRLTYYSTLFNTLEINSTFYKLPSPTTFVKWSSEVGEDFQFTCKLPRSITHVKPLTYQSEEIDRFMRASHGIGEKKGCLLVQFPASVSIEHTAEVEKVIRRLIDLNEKPDWKICIEFRDVRWYENETILRVLDELNVPLVLHDMVNSATPLFLASKPVYVRFHGPESDYKGSYSEAVLVLYAFAIKEWLNDRDVYVYFNNTIGDAFKNAQFLKRLI
ncbi:MAG TPA: DUF72 domain-containing protein [Chryseolinea sp.]